MLSKYLQLNGAKACLKPKLVLFMLSRYSPSEKKWWCQWQFDSSHWTPRGSLHPGKAPRQSTPPPPCSWSTSGNVFRRHQLEASTEYDSSYAIITAFADTVTVSTGCPHFNQAPPSHLLHCSAPSRHLGCLVAPLLGTTETTRRQPLLMPGPAAVSAEDGPLWALLPQSSTQAFCWGYSCFESL